VDWHHAPAPRRRARFQDHHQIEEADPPGRVGGWMRFPASASREDRAEIGAA
jgi:hypothetical protein